VPANIRLHGILESELGQIKGFFGLALGVEDQGLHSLGIAMVGHLLQDLVGSLDTCGLSLVGARLGVVDAESWMRTPLVLLGLIELDNLLEQGLLLGRQRYGHDLLSARVTDERARCACSASNTHYPLVPPSALRHFPIKFIRERCRCRPDYDSDYCETYSSLLDSFSFLFIL
jgi:hypothetical protein